MRLMAIVAVAAVLGLGLGTVYLLYRQMETKTIALSAEPQLEATADGALCDDIDFDVDARTLAAWRMPVEKGKALSGAIAVEGGDNLDIGFRLRAPQNRLVVSDPERQHALEFAVPRTIRGEYIFEFDNRHSALTAKHVTLSVCLA